jgi:hypothetical protein
MCLAGAAVLERLVSNVNSRSPSRVACFKTIRALIVSPAKPDC